MPEFSVRWLSSAHINKAEAVPTRWHVHVRQGTYLLLGCTGAQHAQIERPRIETLA